MEQNDLPANSSFSTSSYGKLYEAQDLNGNTVRKKIVEIPSVKEKHKQDIKRALEILIQMNHPAINQIFIYSLSEQPFSGVLSITMISQFESNGSFDDIMKNIQKGINNANWNSTKKMITIFGIAVALLYIHRSRLIYRNLKPSNILFDENFEPRLADFNFSRLSSNDNDDDPEDSETTEKISLYTAPELFENSPCNNKVDVYSYGSVLYSIFMNKEPDFEMDDQEAIKASIIIGSRPSLSSDLIPSSYQTLISQCWGNTSSDRPSFKSIVRQLSTPEFLLPDVDIDLFIQYTEKVMNDRFLLNEDVKKTQGSRADQLQLRANNGDIEAQYQYAVMLETGNGAVRNIKDAMKYYRMACFAQDATHHLPSMHALALLYESMQKWEEAELLFRTAADEGYKESQFHYALMLKNGSGTCEVDIFKAAKYFKLAADQNDSDAQNYYGHLLLEGQGVILNKKMAADYFKMAADQNDSDAQNIYGMLLKNGADGEIKVNRALAKVYLRKSAEQKDQNGMINYGDFLVEEVEQKHKLEEVLHNKIPIKLKHACYYYLQCSRLGNEVALEKCNEMNIELTESDEEFFANLHGFDEYPTTVDDVDDQFDNDKMEISIKEAADNGDPESQYKYGMILMKEQRKAQLAYAYFQMAADQGHTKAILQQGGMLRDAVGTERNLKKARKLFLKAVDQGSADAMAAYGFMRFIGLGFTTPNVEKAIHYLQKAADMNSGDGIAFLGKALEDKEPERSERLIKQAADLGNANGEYFLALLNRKKNDDALPVESLLRDAAKKGNIHAQYEIAIIDNDIQMLKMAADRNIAGASFRYASKIKDFDFNEALFYFTIAAEQENDPQAMIEAAQCLWNTNPQKCQSYLMNAIQLHYPAAYSLYGRFLVSQQNHKAPISKRNEEEIAHYYHMAASLDDPKGMLYYGLAFMEGKGVSKNYKKAHKYLKMSADKGDVEAMFKFSTLTQDENESIEYLMKASQDETNYQWSNEACYSLAMMYKDKGLLKEALELLKKAAKRGHDDSMFQIAYFYQNGIGVEKNDSKAMKYYALSANSPNAKAAAQFNYALMLKDYYYKHEHHENTAEELSFASIIEASSISSNIEITVDENPTKNTRTVIKNNLTLATKYFRAAAQQGDAEAMNNYGLMLMKGEGMPKNLEEAERYFRMSSDLGNSFAQNNIGMLIKKTDPEEAKRLFYLSASQSNLSGMNNYGLMLMKSEKLEDRIEALSWFKASADEGHSMAMFNYAMMFIKEKEKGNDIIENGKPITVDDVMNKYMKQAADIGNVSAMNSFGSYLLKLKKIKQAAHYFSLSTQKKNSIGMTKLANLLKQKLDCPNKQVNNDDDFVINDIQQAKQMVVDLFQQASDLGNKSAMNHLASLYLTGTFIPKDLEKAKSIYQKSASLGSQKAVKMLSTISSSTEE